MYKGENSFLRLLGKPFLILVNQALQYIMLTVVGVVVVGPTVFYSQSDIFDNVMSYQDFAELEKKRITEALKFTYGNYDDTNQWIDIHMVNVGLSDLEFKHVLVNGTEFKKEHPGTCHGRSDTDPVPTSEYCFYIYNPSLGINEHTNTLEEDKVMRLRLGHVLSPTDVTTVQIVTTSYKLFRVQVTG